VTAPFSHVTEMIRSPEMFCSRSQLGQATTTLSFETPSGYVTTLTLAPHSQDHLVTAVIMITSEFYRAR